MTANRRLGRISHLEGLVEALSIALWVLFWQVALGEGFPNLTSLVRAVDWRSDAIWGPERQAPVPHGS
jgi:hypothetical protein